MVRLRRSKKGGGTKQPQLMEKLVRASLKVNPELRGGDSTHQVLNRLEGDLSTGATRPPGSTPAGAQKTGDAQGKRLPRRRAAKRPALEPSSQAENIEFFFRKKAQDLERALADLDEQRAAIVAEEKRLRQQNLRQVVDFLAVTTSSREEAKAVTTKLNQLIRRLGTSQEQLLAQVEKRRTQY